MSTENSYFQKSIDVPNQNIMNILDFLNFENYFCKIQRDLRENLRKKVDNYSSVGREIGVSRKTVQRIATVKDYWTRFSTLVDLSHFLDVDTGLVFENISEIKTKNSFPMKFNLRKLMSIEFIRVIAHLLGDGGIHVNMKERKYRAFYVNNEQSLLRSFKRDVRFVFGNVNIYSRKRKRRGDEIWLPTTLGRILYEVLEYRNLSEKRAPEFVMRLEDEKLIGAFLQAIFDDEGTVSPKKKMIIISLGNENLLADVKYLIQKLGVVTNKTVKVVPKNRSIMYRFSITSRGNMKKFYQKVGFLHPRKRKKMQSMFNTYRRI